MYERIPYAYRIGLSIVWGNMWKGIATLGLVVYAFASMWVALLEKLPCVTFLL
jgi:hypothetical protein